MKPLRTLVAASSLAFALGFSLPATAQQVCIPGQQLACACPGGTSGIQICNAQGSGLEACQCAPPPEAPPPPPPVAPVPEPAPAPAPAPEAIAPAPPPPACPPEQRDAYGNCPPVGQAAPPPPPPPPPATAPPPAPPPPVPMYAPVPVYEPAPPSDKPAEYDQPTERRPRQGLVTAGAITLVSAYTLTVTINLAACGPDATWVGCDDKYLSLIPGFGPFLFLDQPAEGNYKAIMTLLGLGQVTGIALLTAGFVAAEEVPANTGSSAMRVVPVIAPETAGAVFVGQF